MELGLGDIEIPESNVDSHQPTAEERLFKAIRKKHKISNPFTEEDRIRELSECLRDGANINAVDESGKKKTILHIAVQRDYMDTVQFLVENGADKNITSTDMETPLNIAERLKNNGIIALLGGQVQNINKGEKDGKLYETLLITLLSAKGFEQFRGENAEPFGVGREVNVGEQFKFDDVVFMYPGQNNTKNLILVQSKHKEKYRKISSQILSSPASSKSGMAKDFNLEKYYISYLEARENLKDAKYDTLKNGKIEYCVIFTNAVLDIKDLEKNGFCLKKAPADIISLLNALKSENHCHQFEKLSDELQKKLEKHSDLYKLAKELAKYIVDEKCKNKIMKVEASIQHYHVILGKEVITVDNSKLCRKNKQHSKRNITDFIWYISSRMYYVMHVLYHIWFIFINFPKFVTDLCINRYHFKTIKSPQKLDEEAEEYFKGHFKDDFIHNEDEGTKRNLRNAIFQAIKELDKTKENASSEELKTLLLETEVKLPQSFGKSNQEDDTALPTNDVTDFLNYLIFIDNQPYAEEYEKYVNNIVKDIILRKSLLKAVFEIFGSLGPDVRNRLEKILTIDKKAHHKEWWISEEEIVKIIEEKAQLISVLCLIAVITILYENYIMEWGLFNKLGKIEETLENFLLDNKKKVLCINTPETSLSSIKILQYFSNNEKYQAENGRISVNLNDLITKKHQNIVVEAFKLQDSKLLTIQCTETNRDKVLEEFYKELSNIIKDKHEKQIILVMQPGKPNILREKFMTDFQNTGEYVSESDDIILKDFEPKRDFDPLKKQVILFQGEREKISLSKLIGITNWKSYVDELPKYEDGESIIDAPLLVQLLNDDEIIIGSEPPRISCLEGAYARLFEEINKETFREKLSQTLDNTSDDIYIISGLNGSDTEKLDELVHYLKIEHMREEVKKNVRDIASGYKIQIAEDQFKEKDFVQLCHTYSDNNCFWIIIKKESNEVKFILREIYNPKFYFKRKFQKIDKVFIREDVKELLIRDDPSEIFIFSGVKDQEEFTNSFKFSDQVKNQQLKNNCSTDKIRFMNNEQETQNNFQIQSKQHGVKMVHWLTFEERQIIWRNSSGSMQTLRKHIDKGQCEKSIIEENYLTEKIKEKKVVIIADDPGMGKSTTLIRLYESRNESESILESHWVIKINLRDQLEAIKDIDSENIDVNTVTEFLLKVDLKLNGRLSKHLLKLALKKEKTFPIMLSKPILIAFDGFDELLDEEERNKIISLLKFLKNESGVKFWITTRKQFQLDLEDSLSTFAIEFHPIDEEKTQFITKYLKSRMSLILSKDSFEEVFGNNNRLDESTKIKKYTNAFSRNIQSVFQRSTSKFLGTPLQLYLMLEGSVTHFKNWIQNYDSQPPNFDYLGKNIWEVYEKFIERKYEIYFKKTDVKEQVRQRQDKKHFNQYHKDLAISLIRESEHKNSFIEFKDIVLSLGIVKSQSVNFEFIHPTFGEYFAAQLFIHWIEKSPHVFQNSKKQEYLIKTIFMEPSYLLIRKFMNTKLKEEMVAGKIPEENLRQYGEIIGKLWRLTRTAERIRRGTILHTAVLENNVQIVKFLFNCLEKTINSQKRIVDFLSFERISEGSSFFLATLCGSDDIFELMIHKIGENVYDKQFYRFLRNHKKYIFIQPVSSDIAFKERILMLLDLAESKLSEKDLCKFFGQTDLHRAVIKNNGEKVNSIQNRNLETKCLFHTDKFKKTVLHYSVSGNKYEFTEQILKKAKEISAEDELKLFLCKRDHEDNTVFHIAVNNLNFEITKLILKATKCLHNSTGICELLRVLNDNSEDPDNKIILLKSLVPRTENFYFEELCAHENIHTYLRHLYGWKKKPFWHGFEPTLDTA